ncbi:MAG TPA: terminase, partial [Mycobacteriales bacterium]|nr:terminase [Mycobacteriales bacterium]
AVLQRHMKNARRREGRYGITIGKESRSSQRKIDLAVCAVGARMLWRQMQLGRKKTSTGSGRAVVMTD